MIFNYAYAIINSIMVTNGKSGVSKSTKQSTSVDDKQAQMSAVWSRIEQKATAEGKLKPKDKPVKVKTIPVNKAAVWTTLPIFVIENILLLVLIVSALLGFVSFSTKAPEAKTVAVYNVCGDLVDEYNEKLYAEDYSLDETDKTAQEFIDKIKGLDNADKDATCQHILIESALALDDIATAESSYKTLVDLEDKGVYPSNRLFDATASENLRKSIDAAKEYLEAGPLPEGQG